MTKTKKLKGYAEDGLKCSCGFRLSAPGEFRNCQTMMTVAGTVAICPRCGKRYLVSGEAMTTNGKLSEEKREEVERKFREVKQ